MEHNTQLLLINLLWAAVFWYTFILEKKKEKETPPYLYFRFDKWWPLQESRLEECITQSRLITRVTICCPHEQLMFYM